MKMSMAARNVVSYSNISRPPNRYAEEDYELFLCEIFVYILFICFLLIFFFRLFKNLETVDFDHMSYTTFRFMLITISRLNSHMANNDWTVLMFFGHFLCPNIVYSHVDIFNTLLISI